MALGDGVNLKVLQGFALRTAKYARQNFTGMKPME